MKFKQAYFYRKLENKKVQCELCNHYCVIKNGELGFCYTRKNINGELFSLVYGKPVAINIDPVEKKPLFHFMPGTKTFSLGTYGCNFRCKNCLNYSLSQEREIEKKNLDVKYISPEKIVNKAMEFKCQSIAYTYVEPTIFIEYALDIMKLAHEKGLKNIWVSNGFMSKKCLDKIVPLLDAINVDLKSFDEFFYNKVCGARLVPVLENLKFLKSKDVHLEVTTLIIPSLSDDLEMIKEIAKFIKEELGIETPWHISKFSPEISWQFHDLPQTNYEEIETAYLIGKNAGLKYVYSGNVIKDSKEDTYCPKCNKLVISRVFYNTKRYDHGGKCSECGYNLNIVD